MIIEKFKLKFNLLYIINLLTINFKNIIPP